MQSGSAQTFTKMDTRCHLCTISFNECGSAFLFFYFKMILGFINLLKFSLACLLLASTRFLLWKTQLQFENRTVKCKILTGMIKIVVLRTGFSEIILTSSNTKHEKWEVFFRHNKVSDNCMSSVCLCCSHLHLSPTPKDCTIICSILYRIILAFIRSLLWPPGRQNQQSCISGQEWIVLRAVHNFILKLFCGKDNHKILEKHAGVTHTYTNFRLIVLICIFLKRYLIFFFYLHTKYCLKKNIFLM